MGGADEAAFLDEETAGRVVERAAGVRAFVVVGEHLFALAQQDQAEAAGRGFDGHAEGAAGDVQWNFEKFLVAPGGAVIGRFRPGVEPEAPELVAAIEANLPG